MTDQKATIKEVYDLTGNLRKDMTDGFARIEAQIAAQTLKYALQEEQRDLERRVTNLEKWRWYLVGAFAVVSFFITYFNNEVRHLIFGK